MPYPYRNRLMPSVRNSSFNRMPVSSRRKMVWVRFEQSFADASTAGVFDLLSDWRTSLGITQNLPGYTVIRIRATWQADYNNPGITDDLGIIHAIYVDTTAVGVQANPQTSPNEDYMFWRWDPFTLRTSAAPTDTDSIMAGEIDVKAMRKFEEVGQTLWYTFQVTQAATTVDLTLRGSLLVKLP